MLCLKLHNIKVIIYIYPCLLCLCFFLFFFFSIVPISAHAAFDKVRLLSFVYSLDETIANNISWLFFHRIIVIIYYFKRMNLIL